MAFPNTKTASWLQGMGRDEISKYAPSRAFGLNTYKPPMSSITPKTNTFMNGNAMSSPVPKMGLPESVQMGISRYTGAGADGAVQPLNRVAGQVDEGEAVISNNDLNNIGKDLIGALVQNSRAGQLTPGKTNQIRLALGLKPEKRFFGGVAGGLVSGALSGSDISVGGISGSGSQTMEEPARIYERGAEDLIFRPTPSNPTPTNDMLLRADAPVIENTSLKLGSNYKSSPTNTPTFGAFNPTIQPQTNLTGGLSVGSGYQTSTTPAPTVNFNTDIVAPPPAKRVSPYQNYSNAAMGSIYDTMTGQNPYYAAVANKLQQDAALRASAQEGALRQSQAQRGVAKTGVAASEMSNQISRAESEQAGIAAQTAQAQMGQMAQAGQTLASQAGAGVERDRSQAWGEYNALLAAGDYGKAAEKFGEITGKTIDMTTMEQSKTFTPLLSDFDIAMDEGRETGDYTRARAAYQRIKNAASGNNEFANLVPSEPSWDSLTDVSKSSKISDLNRSIGSSISSGVELWEVASSIDDLVKAETGKTVQQVAAEQGKSEDDVRQGVYDRIKEQSKTGTQAIVRDLEEQLIDDQGNSLINTVEEKSGLANYVNEIYLSNAYTIDDNGKVTVDYSKVVPPWKNPETEHLYRTELSLDNNDIMKSLGITDPNSDLIQPEIERRTGIRNARNAYVGTMMDNNEPASYKDWYGAYEQALEEDITPSDMSKRIEEILSEQADKVGGEITVVDDMGNELDIGISGNEEDFTFGDKKVYKMSQASSGSEYAYKDSDDKYHVLSYDTFREKNSDVSKIDKNIIASYAKLGDSTAIADAKNLVFNYGDRTILAGVPVTDKLYESIASGVPVYGNSSHVNNSWYQLPATKELIKTKSIAITGMYEITMTYETVDGEIKTMILNVTTQ